MNQALSVERGAVRSSLQAVVDREPDLTDVPYALARAAWRTEITTEQNRRAIDILRTWSRYAVEHTLSTDEPYATRYHAAQFAGQEFGQAQTPERLLEVDIATLAQDGISYEEMVARHASPAMLHDPDVAITGGVARMGLKMYAGVDVGSELPISDTDAVITTQADVAAKAAEYGIDLAGAKIVDGKLSDLLGQFGTNVDCTMNQVVAHNGKLCYSEAALQDVRAGAIRLIAKNDPLFGSEGVRLPDGNVYLNRAGFYRGLSFLLREKGGHLVVSEENIEHEKGRIGRYWQVMLFMKILPIQDDARRRDAIGNWHEIAQRIGSTESTSPQAFLEELMAAYPETSAGKKTEYEPTAQAKWILKRLIGESVEQLYGKATPDLPQTYTEANLSLAQDFPEYDYDAFMQYVRDLGR